MCEPAANAPAPTPTRMYILIRDSIPAGLAATAAAHASLVCFLNFGQRQEMQDWLSSSFRKVVCSVDDTEFEQARATPYSVVLTESALDGAETCIVCMPRADVDWPKPFRFYRKWPSPPRVVHEYTDPVKFTVTGTYGRHPKGEDDVYTVAEFKQVCEEGGFNDDDGSGYPVKDGKACRTIGVYPSQLDKIPKDATHVVWYNK